MILPTIRQIQTIADVLDTGTMPKGVTIDQLTAPWDTYFKWCDEWIKEDPSHVEPPLLYRDFVDGFVALNNDHRANHQLISQAMRSPITYPPADQTLAQVPDIQWLWKSWLLRGLPSLLAAVPGTGKSYIALDLARRVITGEQYPDGQPVETPGPVLYVDAENTPSIHKTRLSVWPEPPLSHLYLMLPEPDRIVINLDDHQDRDRLRDMAWVICPALIIIDSYGSCTLKGENNKEDVQGLLAFFNQLAKDFNCGVLIIHHLRKAGCPNQEAYAPISIDAIRGSSHIPAMSRHIWGLQFVPTRDKPDPDANGPRRLWVMKTNVGASPDPLGVAFAPHPDNPNVAQLTYGDAPEPYREMSKVEQCADWILTQLEEAGEPLKPAHLIQNADREGYYSSLIYRARKFLGDLIIDTEQKHRHPNNTWALAEWEEDDADSTFH